MNFDFTKTYILENQRVELRPLRQEDFENLLPFSLNEPELWNYSLTPAAGEENLKSYMDMAFLNRTKQDSYAFIVFDKLTQAYAGTTRFYDVNREHNTLQLGYTWYGKDFQGTGLNKNCKFLMLLFAFEELNVHRVEFRADANNARSVAAMKSLGCQVEGILRSNCDSPGGRRDSIVLSILRDEWLHGIKQKLHSKINTYGT